MSDTARRRTASRNPPSSNAGTGTRSVSSEMGEAGDSGVAGTTLRGI